MLAVDTLEDAKLFVIRALKRKTAAPAAAVPFDTQVASWLQLKNVKSIPMVTAGVDFFVLNYARAVISSRGQGEEGFDPVTGHAIQIYKDAQYTQWYNEMNRVYHERVMFLDRLFYTYLCAATAGELRHAPGRIGNCPKHIIECLKSWHIRDTGDSSRHAVQARFLGNVSTAQTIAYLRDATDIFSKHSWSGSYGGLKWGVIAETALKRATGELDPVMFVDRVFDLKHNGGPIFDKNSIIGSSGIHSFLDAKFELKSDHSWLVWLKQATKPVFLLVRAAKNLGIWKGGLPTVNELLAGLAPHEVVMEKVDAPSKTYQPPSPSELKSYASNDDEEDDDDSSSDEDDSYSPPTPKAAPVIEPLTISTTCPTGTHK